MRVDRFLLVLFTFGSVSWAFAEARLLSPQGYYEVGFEPQEKRYYPNPSARALPDRARQQLYRVSFYSPRTDTAIAVTYFTDIQLDPKGEFPQKPTDIASRILWSPNEDFCLLPLENWPPALKQPAYRQAVAVKTSNTWQTVAFILADTPLIWTDSQTVAGNASTECRDYVSVFNGKTGKFQPIEPGDSSGGYRIIHADANQIAMQRTAPHCGNVDFKVDSTRCVLYDLRFERRNIGACPP